MILFRFRAWPGGPNLLSAGLYTLRGRLAVILFPLARNSVAIPLPIRSREC